MSKEAMKLALEALMRSRKAVSGDLDLAGCAYGKNDPDGHRYDDAKQALVTLDKAIAALQEALAEQPAQQEPVALGYMNAGHVHEMQQGRLPYGYVYPKRGAGASVAVYTSPPAQRKPLTDDPLQGAVDWLLEADGEYFCTATVQRTLRIGYNRAKRLCDTAKERADQDIKGDA